MTYKIPEIPSPRSYKEEKADFWEIMALRNSGQSVSQVQVSTILSQGLDELKHEGIESEDDQVLEGLEDVYIELTRRVEFTAKKYPFTFGRSSLKLELRPDIYQTIYLFLLLCTRFKMNCQKTQNGIDATKTFEKLCSIVARNYFGNLADSMVFGTGESGGFEDKVKEMISRIGEGEAFKNPNKNPVRKNDDGVDVVAWRNFADGRQGKLIAFAQCKTGTSWKDEIYKLKPGKFCNNWLTVNPVFTPLSLVFLCDTLYEYNNFYSDQEGFLIFNRFRIIEYVNPDFDKDVLEEINAWLSGAKKHWVSIVDNNQTKHQSVINFPTQKHWRGKSTYQYVEDGLGDLVRVIKSYDIKSIAIPPLGCGNGGLDWNKVLQIIENKLEHLEIEGILFAPSYVPKPESMRIRTKEPNMTPGRASLIGLLNAYKEVGYSISLLKIQKLMYLMQMAGEPLRLNYEKAEYGPYANNFHHVLQRIEKHFISGYGDRSITSHIKLNKHGIDLVNSFLNEHQETKKRVNQVID